MAKAPIERGRGGSYRVRLSAEERDLLRADMLRERLKTVSRPKPKPAPPAGERS